MRKFTKYNEKLREDKKIWFSQIANMDENLLFMNIANTKTIARIRSKEVVIKIHGQEKVHVTAILCIIADATKLPMLVFIGQHEGRVEKKIFKKILKYKVIKYLLIIEEKLGIMKQ